MIEVFMNVASITCDNVKSFTYWTDNNVQCVINHWGFWVGLSSRA